MSRSRSKGDRLSLAVTRASEASITSAGLYFGETLVLSRGNKLLTKTIRNSKCERGEVKGIEGFGR